MLDFPPAMSRLPDPFVGASAQDLFRLGLSLSVRAGRSGADLIEACALFDIAARLGSIEAKIYRHELAEDLGFVETLEAQALARSWLERRRAAPASRIAALQSIG